MQPGELSDRLLETLAVFEGGGEPLTTTEVTASLDVGRRSTYERLERLVEHGRIETKKVGANARVWWQPAAHGGEASSDGPAAAGSTVDDALDHVEVGIFVLDDDFDVVRINEATERYFGLDREDAVGRNKRHLVEEHIAPLVEDPDGFADTVLATYGENTHTEEFECHVTPGRNRAERWLEHCSEPIETGVYAGGRVELYYDVTDRRESEQVRREDRRQFETFVDTVEGYAVFTLDADGHVRTWNPGAERIKGYAAAEVVGEHVSVFYTDADREDGVPGRNLARAAEEGSIEDEGWRVRSDGTEFWANVTLTAIRDGDGDVEGYAKITRDMTDRRERERELRRERDLFDRVLETSPTGIGVFDSEGEPRRLNRRFAELLGRDPEADPAYTLGEQPLYDPTGDVIPYADRPVPRVMSSGEPVADQRVRVEELDGATRCLSVNASPIGDASEGTVVTMSDVTRLTEQTRRLERQRDELEAELADVFERVDDAFCGLDEEWRFTYVNERAETVLDRSAEALVGRSVWAAFPEAVGSTFQEQYERAMETKESTAFEEYYPPLDAWFEVTAYPSPDGLSVYFRDITGRKERERELERYESIVETVWDGVYALDDDDRFVLVNQAFCDLVGYDREELVGEHPTLINSRVVNDAANELESEILDGERGVGVLEYEFRTATGATVPVETRFGPYEYRDGRYGRCGVARDIGRRKQRERALERFERAVEASGHAIYMTDAGGEITYVNPRFEELTGYDASEAVGQSLDVLNSGRHDESYYRELRETVTEGEVWEEEITDRRADRSLYHAEQTVAPVTDGDGDIDRFVAIQTDVTDRIERERALQDRVRQQEVIADLGRCALEERDLDGLLADGAELVAETLENDYCKVLDLDETAEELLLRQGAGWGDGIVGSATVSAVEADSQAAYTLESDEPVLVSDLETETRFGGPDLLTEHDVRSGISVIVGPHDAPWGILGTHDTDVRTFSEHDVNFVQAVANILATAIERHERERTLVHQREQLAALNNVSRVVRDITDAVIEESSRTEIEQTVCDRLAGADSYLFAWVGEVDVRSRTVNLRAEAGVDGYLDDVTISVDPDDERSEGATGRALRTGEIQTTRDVHADERYDPWRETTEEYGFRSSAAIPIIHDGSVYGVLNVYAERPNAFEGPERVVIAQLGEVVGHAIVAAERERALLGDEVVELEFHAHDILSGLGIDTEPSASITLDHAVPLGDGEYLVFGTASPDTIPVVKAICEASPYWEEVAFEETGETRRFELRISDPPLLRTLSAHGGSLEGAVIEDGALDMTLHVPPAGNVRRIIDAVQEAYPGTELLRQCQISREHDDSRRIQGQLVSELTDRQRTALETAYHAGFFEWPRDASGEDVAESIGVAPPTFHQHLRKAQLKVFDSVFSSDRRTA